MRASTTHGLAMSEADLVEIHPAQFLPLGQDGEDGRIPAGPIRFQADLQTGHGPATVGS